MKLQASDASALEGLQSQNLSRPENRLSVNGLAIVHGRFAELSIQNASFPNDQPASGRSNDGFIAAPRRYFERHPLKLWVQLGSKLRNVLSSCRPPTC